MATSMPCPSMAERPVALVTSPADEIDGLPINTAMLLNVPAELDAVVPEMGGTTTEAAEADEVVQTGETGQHETTEEIANEVAVEMHSEVDEAPALPMLSASDTAILYFGALKAQALPMRSASCPELEDVVEQTAEPPPPEVSELPVVPERPRLRRGRTWPLNVSFGDEVVVHPITPYAEIYGMHPRYFDFAKGFAMVPAQGFGAARVAHSSASESTSRGDDEDEVMSEDDFSDEDFSDGIRYLAGPHGRCPIEYFEGHENVQTEPITITAC